MRAWVAFRLRFELKVMVSSSELRLGGCEENGKKKDLAVWKASPLVTPGGWIRTGDFRRLQYPLRWRVSFAPVRRRGLLPLNLRCKFPPQLILDRREDRQ